MSRPQALLDPDLIRQWAGSLKGPVIVPGDMAYDEARKVWNLAVDLRPAAIVQCHSADDILRTVEFVRVNGITLAVRGGGHSQAGHGACEGGIVADLGGLRAIQADVPRRRVCVSAGARVSDVMAATEAHGLVTPMGGCPDVGVGGLTLGGGANFLMARYGAVCDNVLAARVVVADGRLLTASPDEHADLFWALRGGGGNFGVVVSFDYRLHDIGELLSGQFVFPVSRAAETLRRYRDLMADPPDELETSGGLTPDERAFFVAISICGDRTAAERLVDTWRSVLRPASDNMAWGPYSAGLVVPPAASDGTGIFLPELSDPVADAIVAAITSAPPGATLAWNDFHGAVTRVPLDEMAFPLRHRGYDVFISAPWTDAAGRARATTWIDEVARALRPHGHAGYINNLTDKDAHRVRDAYAGNYERLAAIKRTYDPDNLFHRNHNIPPT